MLNTTEIISSLEKDKKISISFHYHTETLLKSFDALFSKLLAKVDKIYLLDSIITIMREIISNAVKANSKRYYFKKLNLNIHDQAAYTEGMKNFRMDVIGSENIEKNLKNTDFRVMLSIEMVETGINIIVENNTIILPEELKRIDLRIKKAREYKDFTDAYDEIYDETEGAGLGIVLIILLLKNSGIGEESFAISSNGKVTQSKFTLPHELKPQSVTTKIKEQIIKEIDGLPTFSDHIVELLRLCKDPDASIEQIVNKIIVDPALTSDILKLSNSAGFITGKKVEHINEALMIIGFSNLYDLLLITGTRQILEKRYKKFHEIWNHCTRTASYARQIAQKYTRQRYAEFAFLGGLLHDLGKLVLLATDTKFTSWISDLTKDRKIRTSTVLEEVTIGISHPAIGELMAKKWNFPDYLVEAIKYHHCPLSADAKAYEYIFPVYLANMLCGFETGKYHYFYLEETILNKFKLSSKKAVDELHMELKNNYKE